VDDCFSEVNSIGYNERLKEEILAMIHTQIEGRTSSSGTS
jgi:hypothetical protein